jgi:serine/threonine protein phosphatase PrpC
MYESTQLQTSIPQEMYDNFATERVVPLGRNSQGNEGQNSQSISMPEGDGAIAKVTSGSTDYLFYRVDGDVASVALDGGQVVPGTETVLPEKIDGKATEVIHGRGYTPIINDATLSRKHFSAYSHTDISTLIIADNDSTHGTYVSLPERTKKAREQRRPATLAIPKAMGSFTVAVEQKGGSMNERLKDRVAFGSSEARKKRPDGSGEDAAIIKPSAGLYGVFDGAGGVGHGREASHAARDAFRALTAASTPRDLIEMFKISSQKVAETGGVTTATAVLVREHEDPSVMDVTWASVGDSRLYAKYPDGKIIQLSKDEGYANIIENYLGDGAEGLKQAMTVRMPVGTRLMLCTDGVTGDYEGDFIDPQIFAETLATPDPKQAARKFTEEVATKNDDRGVIILDLLPKDA